MQVLSLDEAAYRAGVVRRTLERMLAEGTGPAKVQVSKRRVGILEADLERWLNSRRSPTPGDEVHTIQTQLGLEAAPPRSISPSPTSHGEQVGRSCSKALTGSGATPGSRRKQHPKENSQRA